MASLKHQPSLIAGGAIFLVNKIHKREGWPSAYEEFTLIKEAEVRLPAKDLYLVL